MSNKHRGHLLVVSSPSGAGKTTLCNRLRQEFSSIGFSVSYTTRQPRAGEKDGREYHFISPERFQDMAVRDEFAEYATVHGNMYGSSRAEVERALSDGTDLLFDIDFQGARQLKQKFPDESVVLIFIMPPSVGALEERLKRRATDADSVIRRRLEMAHIEMERYDEYDFVIVNDNIDAAYDALRAIYVAGLHRRERQAGLAQAILCSGEPP